MRVLWQARSNPVAWWWALLTFASAGNIALWCVLYRQLHVQAAGNVDRASELMLMLFLCGAYVFGCAFRSVLPRADVQRICLFDTWLSSVALGRSVATVAEISFAMQWALVLHRLDTLAGSSDIGLQIAAWGIVPLIVVAQCCSWYGVLTTNYLANAIENSIWAVAFLIIGIGLCRLLPEFHDFARLILVVAIIGIAVYLAFLITIDVPMYVGRWQKALRSGNKSFGPQRGSATSAHAGSSPMILRNGKRRLPGCRFISPRPFGRALLFVSFIPSMDRSCDSTTGANWTRSS